MRRIKDGSYRVAIGKNPWKLKSGEDVHIGKFLRKHYGGGGHPGAGGADIKSKKEPEMLGREIVSKLRKESKKNI
jgi:nanoRNase/pAp phosphatase (c-di-AMP/oligoRNAs hydrolase)